MTVKPVNAMLLVLIIATLVAGGWLHGQRSGERKAVTLAGESMSSPEAQNMIFVLQAQLLEKSTQALNAEQVSQASSVRAQTLQRQLDALMDKSLLDDNDLALYRRIENSTEPRGIVVETVSWKRMNPEELRLRLVQWQGRNRVRGEIQVTLNYLKAVPGSTRQANTEGAEKVNWAVDLKPVAFDFRFFQKFTFPTPSLNNARLARNGRKVFPDSVDIRIASSDKRLNTIDSQIPWTKVSE